MQVYKGLDIGTAKITEEEKEGISHFMFDIANVTDNFTVKDYQSQARKILEKYQNRNIIIVGGTGLYLKALLYDYNFLEEHGIKHDYSSYTNEELLSMCKNIDSTCDIHVNNRVRLERFLERGTKPVSNSEELYKAIYIGLTTNREKLYKIIDNRV